MGARDFQAMPCARGEIGKRNRLKSGFPLCRFESCREHQQHKHAVEFNLPPSGGKPFKSGNFICFCDGIGIHTSLRSWGLRVQLPPETPLWAVTSMVEEAAHNCLVTSSSLVRPTTWRSGPVATAADCRSVTLDTSRVRVLPSPPLCRCGEIGKHRWPKPFGWKHRTGSNPVTGTICIGCPSVGHEPAKLALDGSTPPLCSIYAFVAQMVEQQQRPEEPRVGVQKAPEGTMAFRID